MGNYDNSAGRLFDWVIIPQREKMGNYDQYMWVWEAYMIIPQREKMGNYDKEKPFRLRL